jgi:hypothetical protein
MSTTTIDYETVYEFSNNWYMMKFYRGKMKGDRYLLFTADDDNKIIMAVYGKMVQFDTNKLAVKGALITKDVCNIGNKSEIKTYPFNKEAYLSVGINGRGDTLKEEARLLLAGPDSYFTEEKVK